MGMFTCLLTRPESNKLKYTAKELKEIKVFNTEHNSRISFLEDSMTGRKFLLKQERRSELHWHIIVAREALGAHIANSIDIPANRVEIIPAYIAFSGKHNKERPATLHTVVPGVKVNKSKKLKPLRICIQQFIKPAIPKERWGLTREVVRSMALHKDLSRIAALDTFIANGDRHRANFLYDQETDTFFAIDLESAFKKDLAYFGVKFLINLLQDKEKQAQLSAEEIQGLRIYRDTLKRLLSKHTPNSLYQKFLTYVIQAGIMPRMGRGPVGARVNEYKGSIEKNYASCKKLILLLDQFMVKRAQESTHKNRKRKVALA